MLYSKAKQLKTSFSYMQAKMYLFNFWLFEWTGGGGGGIQLSDWVSLALQLSSNPYLCICELRNQSENKFKIQNMKKWHAKCLQTRLNQVHLMYIRTGDTMV